MAAEVGLAGEVTLDETGFEPVAQLGEAVQVDVFPIPFGEVDTVAAGRSLVDQIPAELVHDEHTLRLHEHAKLVEDEVEVDDVVERVARDDGIERLRVDELFDLGAPENRPLGRHGIDCNDVVAQRVESQRQLTLAAADFENPRSRRGQM